MSTASLICPGPSVVRTYAPEPGRLVVAVNRAACLYSSDIFVANDWTLIASEWPNIIGKPQLVTTPDSLASLRRKDHPATARAETLQGIFPASWTLFTAPSALIYLGLRDVTSIKVYGADWTQESDADGKSPPSCRRDAARWETERVAWDAVVAWLNVRGVSVHRVPSCPLTT